MARDDVGTTSGGAQQPSAAAAAPSTAARAVSYKSQRTQTMPQAGVDMGTQTSEADLRLASGGAASSSTTGGASKGISKRRKARMKANARYERAMRLIRKAARKRRKEERGSVFLARAAALGAA